MTNILIIGLDTTWIGRANKQSVSPSLRPPEQVQASIDKMQAELQSFNNTTFKTIHASPGGPGDWEEVETALKEGKWNGISIGGGVRKHADLGEYFTRVMNLAICENPKAVYMFPTIPDDVVPAVRKYLPQAN